MMIPGDMAENPEVNSIGKGICDILTIEDINEQDAQGKTRLHRAIEGKNVPEVLELLNQQACCDIQDHRGRTPLHKAVECLSRDDTLKVIIEMLKSGADCNIQDEY